MAQTLTNALADAQVLTDFTNLKVPFTTNRLGVQFRTIYGINEAVDGVISQAESQFEQALQSLGIEYPPIQYAAGLTIDRITQSYERNGVIYVNTAVDSYPITTTGNFDEAGWQIVQAINSATVVFNVADKKSLADVPKISGAQYSKPTFWSGIGLGGGIEVWNPDRPKADHNGGTVTDPDKLSELGLPSDADPFGTYFTASSEGLGCFELIEKAITPELFGAFQSEMSMHLPLQASASAAAGKTWSNELSNYHTSKEIIFSYETTIVTSGKCTINGNLITAQVNAPGGAVVTVGGGYLLALPDLSSDITDKALEISFSSAHGLVENDVFLIHNPTDFSYSSFRANYQAGEFCRVQRVLSATSLILDRALYSGYNAVDVNLFKVSGGSVNIQGDFNVLSEGSGVILRSVKLKRVVDGDLSGLRAISNTNRAGLELEQCCGITGYGVIASQYGDSGGDDYGIVFANSQDVEMSGFFTGRRHGITTGGYNVDGAVPCRNIRMSGTCKSESGDGALDTHGNTEYFHFEGYVYGAVQSRGNHISAKATIVCDKFGRAIRLTELSGWSHDYSNCSVMGSDGDIGAGVITIGFGNSVADSTQTKDGILDFSGVSLDTPLATKLIYIDRKQSLGGNTNIDLSNLKIQNCSENPNIEIKSTSGQNFKAMRFYDYSVKPDTSFTISGINRVGADVSGSLNLTTQTTSNSVSQTVTFPFSFGVEPSVFAQASSRFIGSVAVISGHDNRQPSSFLAYLITPDATNFTTETTRKVSWQARLDVNF